VSAVLLASLLVAARRLLLTTLDPGAARLAGISTRAADLGFLLLVGSTAAAASQAVGPLLALGLLVAPAAAAHRLTPRAGLGMLLAALVAVGATWTGLAVSTAVAWVPANAGIVLAAVAVYVAVNVAVYVAGGRVRSAAAFAARRALGVGAVQAAAAQERGVRVDHGAEPLRQGGDGG
jgi:zinc/manganese transport system permease protein